MRLIDADALLREHCGECDYIEYCTNTEPTCGTAGWVKDAQTIDAVPVIRCKDCVKRPTCEHTRALGIYGYCSDGEKA